MQRKLTLSKDAYLWEEGDHARNIAIVEQGKLAIRSGSELVGIVLPRMVVGEVAIQGMNGNGARRSASATALVDDTVVVEYTPSRIKHAFDNAQPEVGRQILMTVLGQTFRNLFLLMSTRQDEPLVVVPLKGLLTGLVQTVPQLKEVTEWKGFLTAFSFLCAMRDSSGALRSAFLDTLDELALDRATEAMKQHFGGNDILPVLEEFFRAEKEVAEWLEP